MIEEVPVRFRRFLVLGSSLTCIVLLALTYTGHRPEDSAELLSTGGSGTSFTDSNMNWGSSNPTTGMMRVGCGTSVANDNRFWAAPGTTFTVECPAHCAHNGERSVYGCSIFMDDSSICRAAIARNYLGHQNSGIVTFKIQPPIQTFPGCTNMPTQNCDKYPGCGRNAFQEDTQIHTVTSFAWTWQQWPQADKPDKIAQFGREGAILKYRTQLHGDGYRYGLRAFTIEQGDTNLGLISDGAVASSAVVTDGSNKLSRVDSDALTVELWVRDFELRDRSAYISASREAPPAPTSAPGVTVAAGSASTSGSGSNANLDFGFILGTECGSFAWGVAGRGTAAGRMSFISAPKWLSEQYRGQWVHLAGTYDGASQEMKLFVAGNLVATGNTQSGRIRYFDSPLLFASRLLPSGTVVGMKGELDEVRIWSLALNKDDLARYMHETLQEPLRPTLVAYWRFDGQDEDSRSVCAEVRGWNATMTGGMDYLDSAAPVEMLSVSSVC